MTVSKLTFSRLELTYGLSGKKPCIKPSQKDSGVGLLVHAKDIVFEHGCQRVTCTEYVSLGALEEPKTPLKCMYMTVSKLTFSRLELN